MEGSDGENQQVNTNTTSEPEVAIEIEESWVDSVSSRVDASFVPRWRKEPCSIFRVPANLRSLHPDAYEPRVVSIGPYHHGKAHLEPMEKHKWRMVRRLLSKRRKKDVLRECLHKVKALEERARSCYSEVIDMKSNEFVEMMILDSCFLIGVLFLEWSGTIERKYKDTATTTTTTTKEEDNWVWMEQKDEEPEKGGMHSSLEGLWDLVVLDLLKLENQIPFFIVEALWDLLVLQADLGFVPPIYDLALSLLNKFDPSDYSVSYNPTKVYHLFHIFYHLLVPGDQNPSSVRHNLIVRGFLKLKRKTEDLLLHVHKAIPSFLRSKTWGEKQYISSWLKSATELQEAGVQFVEKFQSSFLDVSFKDGVMEFPIIGIYDSIFLLFRNLIAFEQCCPNLLGHITFYAVLMDAIIDTPRDVKVLQQAGILRIGLRSEKEVAQFFNSVCEEVFYNNEGSYLIDMFYDVNRYCNSKSHKWRAVLARDYFNSPWAVISVVAAFVLLGLTLLQTFYTMYAYYHPPS